MFHPRYFSKKKTYTTFFLLKPWASKKFPSKKCGVLITETKGKKRTVTKITEDSNPSLLCINLLPSSMTNKRNTNCFDSISKISFMHTSESLQEIGTSFRIIYSIRASWEKCYICGDSLSVITLLKAHVWRIRLRFQKISFEISLWNLHFFIIIDACVLSE